MPPGIFALLNAVLDRRYNTPKEGASKSVFFFTYSVLAPKSQAAKQTRPCKEVKPSRKM